jgi:uncharacterized protein (DUF1499 family)
MTPNGADSVPPRRRNWAALLALVLGLAAALMLAAAGPGTRFGWWHFRTGFQVMRWSAMLGIAAILAAVLALLLARRARSGVKTAILALLLGLVAFGLPWSLRRGAGKVPPIHDITTDWTNPPPITWSRALRDTTEGMNTWRYEGDSIAAQQRQAYPDIRPVMLPMTPDSAWGVAYATAREMGWEILEVRREEGVLEAAAVTPWFGFVDDVVVRVTPASGIARVDVRSKSRIGRSDVGANAHRIRAYTEKLKERGGEASGS